MSRPLHICNTFFESELESQKEWPSPFWMNSHPVVTKLQTLPLLYADPGDLVWPSEGKQVDSIESWGASKAIAAWAKERNIPYSMPDWEIVKEVNSKIFSSSPIPQTAQAELLQNEKEALLWIEKTPGRKVLKDPVRHCWPGPFPYPWPGQPPRVSQKRIAKKLPLIGEPWVERILDFSTQWKDAKLLGATVFENTPNGSYRATIAGPTRIFGSYQSALKNISKSRRPS